MLQIDKDRERVDWFRIVCDLERKGINIPQMSRKLEIPESTIKGWKKYIARPKFEEGITVILFWCEQTGQTVSEVPIYDRYAAH